MTVSVVVQKPINSKMHLTPCITKKRLTILKADLKQCLRTLSFHSYFILIYYQACFLYIMWQFLTFLGLAKLVFIIYRSLGQFLSTENATIKLGADFLGRNSTIAVNSHVISVSINKESSRVYLTDPVLFTLPHIDVS